VVIRHKMGFQNRRPRRDDQRINRRIRVPEIRLIGSDGEQLGLINTREALRKAEDEGLDLVEISPMARPPVCKIMDYGKHKYEQSKRKHEQKKRQVVIHVKEIKLRPSTDEHDFQTKLRHVKRFLEAGDKVKITIRFRGREMAHVDIGHERMKKMMEEVRNIGEVEFFPKMEGRQMFMMLVPIKKKPKGGGKPKEQPKVEPKVEDKPKKRELEIEKIN